MTSKHLAILWLTAIAASAAGCASNSCGDAHPYQGSRAHPPLQAPAGVSLPLPDPAYQIPGDTGVGQQRTDVDAAGHCMDAPPQLIPAVSTAAAAVKTTAPAVATTQSPAASAPPQKAGAQPATPTPPSVTSAAPVAAPPPLE